MARFGIRLTPRGGADRIEGVDPDGTLKVRVSAPPVDGEANAALCRLLARELGVPKSRVTIVAGETARRKVIEAEGADPAHLRERWPGLAV